MAQDLRRWNRSEKHQNFSESVPAGPVRGDCWITSCRFISFSCTEDLHPERFFRVNIRSESERGGAALWRATWHLVEFVDLKPHQLDGVDGQSIVRRRRVRRRIRILAVVVMKLRDIATDRD